jgi:hypothetical protein
MEKIMACDKERVKFLFNKVMEEFLTAFVDKGKVEDGIHILCTCFLPVCREDRELYRMWYEGIFMEWMKERITPKGYWLNRDEAFQKCLMENRPEFYDDKYVFEMLVRNNVSNEGGVYLIWMRRLCGGRKPCLDRGDKYGATFLKELYTGNWIGKWIQEEGNSPEDVSFCFQLAMDNIESITGEYKELSSEDALPKEECAVLDCDDSGLLMSCIKNGMLRKKYVDEYIDYSICKGKLKIIPYLIQFKHSDK